MRLLAEFKKTLQPGWRRRAASNYTLNHQKGKEMKEGGKEIFFSPFITINSSLFSIASLSLAVYKMLLFFTP